MTAVSVDRRATTGHAHDWQADAACHDPGIDPELFFPVGTTGPLYNLQVRTAQAICWQCPVARACLHDAIRTGEREGIRGGLTPRQRGQMTRKRPA
jgi:WhiB family transcriptional regulator, redox-sensing transcriptional regulator